ncbi:MAG: aminoglycoside phosphotransferase family protein [Deltaproteobacteria bacterium]|nr:aminoglycoside phosphotransferase family protein [Deltaproteobacteria bacterium]
MSDALAEASDALAAWSLQRATVSPLGTGLINRTFLVDVESGASPRLGDAGRAVLQRLNAIFDPRIHENIAAVTRRLGARGQATLSLVETDDGRLWADRGGVYRLYRHVDGSSFDVVTSFEQARSAGRLVGAFHAALEGLDHGFVGMRQGVHDTARHLAILADAVASHRAHPLHVDVGRLARTIAMRAAELPPLPPLALRIGHGDLKLGNILFERMSPERALCLVDLDTVGPIHLGHELGDMWRSWCNRSTEDDDEARLDLDVLGASWNGFVEGLGRRPNAEEVRAALLGLDWIALELSARFAADALLECYFGWDPSRFETRGAHNLARARGQFALFEAAVACRDERAALLGSGVAQPPFFFATASRPE